jgi:uncharacterized membrane protein
MNADSPTPDDAYSHSHSHDGGGWSAWPRTGMLQAVLVIIACCAVATVFGIIALWPSEEGRQSVVSNADEMGLVTDRLSAVVTDITDGPCSYSTADRPQPCRMIFFELHEGPNKGQILSLPEFNLAQDRFTDRVDPGSKIIVGYEDATDFYFYADRDRRVSLAWLGALFAAIVIGFGRLRGFLALVAMASTLAVLVLFVGPSVLDGNDPVLVSVVAAAAIAFVSLYLTHGFTPTTTIALSGTLAALALTFGLSWAMFEIAQFTGLATEEALILPFLSENINVAGLLLGGAVIGALGALDDVTVTQVATVAELRRHNPNLSSTELTASGIRIGREHIASTVNTLLLAYAGASMPLLLLFAVSDQSLVMIANSELIAVEIVRTLCGSIGLIAAVPVTTALAAAVLRPANRDSEPRDQNDSASENLSLPEKGPDAPASSGLDRPPQWEDFAPDDLF